jgi:membrane protein implicated in regulation of membrane protease activity
MVLKLNSPRRAAAAETPPPPPAPARWQPPEVVLPDWEDLRRKAREQGAADAKSPAFDAITLKTQGYEPQHLIVLDSRRQSLVNDVRAQLARHESQARAAKEAHVRRAEIAREEYVRARAAHDMVRDKVAQLEIGPSQWPGDGRPSSVALTGGWREMLRAWGAPALLLLALLAVETPIYYGTFLDFGESSLMTYALAIGAIFVFVFGPHMYGRKFREWQEFRGRPAHELADEEEVRKRRRGLAQRPVLLFLIPVIWFLAITAVVTLRMSALTAAKEITVSGVTVVIPAADDGWKLAATIVVFLALMTFTALIAAELGRRTGNPNDQDLREQRIKLERATAALAAAEANLADADEYGKLLDDFLDGAERDRELIFAQIDAKYDEVEAMYMEGLVADIDDPDAARYGPAVLDRHQRRHYIQADS